MSDARVRVITEQEFDNLAEVAANDNCLKERETEHGKAFAIVLNGHVMAEAKPHESGEYSFVTYM